MPDLDGLHVHFRREWKACLKYISEGERALAQALHATLTRRIALAIDLEALQYVQQQLLIATDSGRQVHSALQLPSTLRLRRTGELALRAGYAVLEDLPAGPASATGLTAMLVRAYLVELADQQFLGILAGRGVPTYFPSNADARAYVERVRQELHVCVGPTVEEICSTQGALNVCSVGFPPRQKKTQEEVLATEIIVSLEP